MLLLLFLFSPIQRMIFLPTISVSIAHVAADDSKLLRSLAFIDGYNLLWKPFAPAHQTSDADSLFFSLFFFMTTW